MDWYERRQAWERVTRALLKEVWARPLLWTRRVLWAHLKELEDAQRELERQERHAEARQLLAQGLLQLQ